MNLERALQILCLDSDQEDDAIKRAYRAKILQYHPDKNKSDADAARKFQEVREAYLFLTEGETGDFAETGDFSTGSYEDVLRDFLMKILEEEYADLGVRVFAKIFNVLIRWAAQKLESKSAALLESLNRPALVAVHTLLLRYREAFHLPDELFERIGELLANRKSADPLSKDPEDGSECIVLNPTLDDLFTEENIYKLKFANHTYLVPLWHHEMMFEHEGRDLTVRCVPVLPDNMEIDEWNVLSVWLEYKVEDVWNREVFVDIGGQTFSFDGRKLRLTEEEQEVVLEGCGLLYNNIMNIFDATKKQNIVLLIRLRLSDRVE